MAENWIAQLTDTPAKRRSFEQEMAIANATELISHVMEERGTTKAELARMLGTSRAHVTGLLSGSRNMTIRTFADAATVLGVRVRFDTEPLRDAPYVVTEPPQRLPRSVHSSASEPCQDAAFAASSAEHPLAA